MGARNRKLNTLVFADRVAEDFAFTRIIAGAINEPARVTDTFGRDQNTLGIHAIENISEALAFFTNQVFRTGTRKSSKKSSVVA